MQALKPVLQPLSTIAKRHSLVIGDIVAAPHEGIDGTQGLPLGFWKNEKSVVEILGGATGDATANGIRDRQLRSVRGERCGRVLHSGAHNHFPSAARARRASLRGFEMKGRRPST